MSASEKVIRIHFPSVPTPKEWLFTLKVFASAMLSVYVSLKIGLAHPFWAVGTCFVIAAPMAGPVRSKGLYRAAGTLLSGAMVVITIPLLANYRIIYTFILAGWAGICMYISLLDRTPRAYTFMMAGYTAGIIGLPLLAESSGMTAAMPFDIASTRLQEIIIGLCCSALIHGLIFPQSIGNALLARLDQAINDAQRWSADVLLGIHENQRAPLHRKLAQDITELRLMATHLPFDTHNIRWTTNVVRVLSDRLASLIPIVSGMEDRMRALREGRSEILSSGWGTLLNDIADWSLRGRPFSERARQLRARIKALTPETSIHADWSDLLKINFAYELEMLIDALEHCFQYRYQIEIGVKKGVLQAVEDVPAVPNRALNTDKGQALMASLAVVISTVVTTVIWTVTDWPYGYNAPMFACIMSSIFAAQDNPNPGLKVAFMWTLYSVPVSAIYLLLVIPSAHTIEMLILVLAPFYLWAGLYLANPATAGKILMTMMGVVGMLMLYDFNSPNLTTFINGQVAQLFGIAAALYITKLLRNVNIERLVRRVMRTGWTEIASMAQSMRPVSPTLIAVRMTDKVSLLAPRLAAVEQKPGQPSLDMMEDIRVGINLTHLLNHQHFLSEQQIALEPFMKTLSVFYKKRLAAAEDQDRELIAQLDRLIYQVTVLPSSPEKNSVLASLAGIRRDIFPAALFQKAAVSAGSLE